MPEIKILFSSSFEVVPVKWTAFTLLRNGELSGSHVPENTGACSGPMFSWVVKAENNETFCAREKGRLFYLKGAKEYILRVECS